MTNKKLTLVLLLIWSGYASAQDPVFYQNDNAQVYNNPAFIGTCESASFDLTYRNQWPEISGNYITTAFSANQYLGKGNGVSLMITSDNAAQATLTNRIGAGYSKQFSISENHHFSIGVQAVYFSKNLNLQNLTFGDQIDPRQGFVYQTAEPSFKNPVRGVDFNSGILYHNEFIFAGIGVHHILQPNQGFTSNSPLPRKYSFQVGGKINIKEFTFVPLIQGNTQGSFNSLISSLKTRYKSIELDLGYAHNNGPTGGMGLRFNSWNIGYNYGYANSSLSQSTISTHEIRAGFQPKLFNKTNETYFDF